MPTSLPGEPPATEPPATEPDVGAPITEPAPATSAEPLAPVDQDRVVGETAPAEKAVTPLPGGSGQGPPGRDGTAQRAAPRRPIDKERRQRILAGWLLFSLTVVCGLLLLALVLVLGRRLRRIAHRPLPRTSPPEPFWFLRPRRPRGDPGPHDPRPRDQSEPDRPDDDDRTTA